MKQIKEFKGDNDPIFKKGGAFDINTNDVEKEFIKSLLCEDQNKRWSAVTALASDWMK